MHGPPTGPNSMKKDGHRGPILLMLLKKLDPRNNIWPRSMFFFSLKR